MVSREILAGGRVAARAAEGAATLSSGLGPRGPSMRFGVGGDGDMGQDRWRGGMMGGCGRGIPKGVRAYHWVGARGSIGVGSLLCGGPGGYARGFMVMMLPGALWGVYGGDVWP